MVGFVGSHWSARYSFLVKRFAFVLFGLLAIGCYLRLFFSVGLLGYMDESYWIASSLLSSLGGTPYVDELYIQQNAGLLFEPFTALYFKLFGNFALVLFIRHLYFALALLCSWIWFRCWRDRVDTITALVIALLPLVGSFWAEPSPGYNAVGLLGFGTGMLLTLRGLERESLPPIAGSAAFFALALDAYPTLLGGVLIFWIVAVALSRRLPWKAAALNLGLTGALTGAFLLTVILRAGLANVLFAYTFSTAHASLGSFTGKFSYGLKLWLAFLPPIWFWIPLYLVWLWLWWKRDLAWQFFVVPVCVYMLLQTPPEEGPIQPALVLLLALSGAPLVFRAGWSAAVLWCAGLLAAGLTLWSSALTLYATYVTATSALAAVYAASKPRTPWIALLTFFVPLTIFYDREVSRTFDDRSTELEMFSSGPNAGLWTSRERYGFLNQVESDVSESASGLSTILFYSEFPMGYLMSNLRPATKTMFLHGLRESGPPVQNYFRQYYSDPNNRPDVIFRFKYFDENGVRRSVDAAQYKPYEDPFWNYLPSETEYSLWRDRNSYSIFKRKK